MKTILILFLTTISFSLSAQSIEYTYDAAGNRTTRQVIVLDLNEKMGKFDENLNIENKKILNQARKNN